MPLSSTMHFLQTNPLFPSMVQDKLKWVCLHSCSVYRTPGTLWIQTLCLSTSTMVEECAHSQCVLNPSGLGRTALNGCGLVIWGLICKANANYLKLGLRGIEHSLKIAFVLFENHSLAWQDCYHQSGERIGELDPFVHCRKSIPFFWVTGSYGKRQWRQVTGQSQLRTGLRGEGLGQKAGCPGGGVGNSTAPSRDALGSSSS